MSDYPTREAAYPEQPNPGSKAATVMSCTCPVIDNGHGRGNGRGEFWITEGCPLHASPTPTDPPKPA